MPASGCNISMEHLLKLQTNCDLFSSRSSSFSGKQFLWIFRAWAKFMCSEKTRSNTSSSLRIFTSVIARTLWHNFKHRLAIGSRKQAKPKCLHFSPLNASSLICYLLVHYYCYFSWVIVRFLFIAPCLPFQETRDKNYFFCVWFFKARPQ